LRIRMEAAADASEKERAELQREFDALQAQLKK
jgi:hypothetical protein